MWDPAEPLLEVDVFVTHPIPFEELWGRSEEIALEQVPIRIASIPDLIALKRLAGRRSASARRRKFLLGLRATPAERLRWLEDSLRVAQASGALQTRRAADRKRAGLWDDEHE